jgi:hypothetical protein
VPEYVVEQRLWRGWRDRVRLELGDRGQTQAVDVVEVLIADVRAHRIARHIELFA